MLFLFWWILRCIWLISRLKICEPSVESCLKSKLTTKKLQHRLIQHRMRLVQILVFLSGNAFNWMSKFVGIWSWTYLVGLLYHSVLFSSDWIQTDSSAVDVHIFIRTATKGLFTHNEIQPDFYLQLSARYSINNGWWTHSAHYSAHHH